MKNNIFILVVLMLLCFACSTNNKEAGTDLVSGDTQEKKSEVQAEEPVQIINTTINLTKSDFLKKVFNYEKDNTVWKYLGDKPAIIDFYADWCGPCKKIAPVLEELADEYAGEIYIYKVDTDKEQELSTYFNIRSIPSILFIPVDGKPQMTQGAMPKDIFVEIIEDVLLKK